MKGILSSIIISVIIFFLLIFIQEYKTVVLPLFVKSKVDNTERIDAGIETIKNFNELIVKAYKKQNPGILSRLPSTDEIKNEFKKDIEFLIKEKIKLYASLEEFTIIDAFQIDENTISITAEEIWRFKEMNGNEDIQQLNVKYRIKKEKDKFVINGINYNGDE